MGCIKELRYDSVLGLKCTLVVRLPPEVAENDEVVLKDSKVAGQKHRLDSRP